MVTEKNLFGPDYREVSVGDIEFLAVDKPIKLKCGKEIKNFPIAYQSYGKLNADKSNAILICHGLTGDQYVSGTHPVTGKPGWWDGIVGKGKIIDTDRFFVISPNVIGGCMGSFGPKSINEKTGEPYNLNFPFITISDMAYVNKLLVEKLGIDKLFAVIGGSMGGMISLDYAITFSDSLRYSIVIAGAARHTAQNIAFNEVGRQAIMIDPNWCNGNYINEKKFPSLGLAVGRMMAHVTYLSESGLERKFGRLLQDRDYLTYGFDADFQVESYLRYQGSSFVQRFDPNTYLYITRAMDYFDLIGQHNKILSNAFKDTKVEFCIISFSSDWLFPTEEARIIVHALNAALAKVSSLEIVTDKGHDAFLLDEPCFLDAMRGFFQGKLDDF